MNDTNTADGLTGDLLAATPRNIRALYPEHGNKLMAVSPETADEFSVNPGDYAGFADMDDDEPFRDGQGGACVLALRGPAFQVFEATALEEGEPAYTIVGRYRDNDQTYIATVYTHEGPKAAATLGRNACAEEGEMLASELDLDIVAIFEGEPTVAARGDEAEL